MAVLAETITIWDDLRRRFHFAGGCTSLRHLLGDVVPLLVIQPYGLGTAAVLATATTWRWAAYIDADAKTLERIQLENLEVTRVNLELARSREAIGQSSPGEVYRWEGEIANLRIDVIRGKPERYVWFRSGNGFACRQHWHRYCF